MKTESRSVFDKNIINLFKKAISIMIKHPGKLWFFINAFFYQYRAKQRRNQLLSENIEVPPLLIISITNECNLNCSGCYSKHLHSDHSIQISKERFKELLEEAGDLGISLILLAGGEPLMRWDLIEIASKYPKIMFPIFTNGLLINNEMVRYFKKHQQLFPVISIEGHEKETDQRRGSGIWDNFQLICDLFKHNQLFWGASITVNKNNYDLVTSDYYLKQLIDKGCSIVFFVEYVAITDQDNRLCLTNEQKINLNPLAIRMMSKYSAMFVAFPGDEAQYGGCLAAGRGFFHINALGQAEPCPFAPYSDKTIINSSIKDVLKSDLFQFIRDHHHLLKETEGGCALWSNREFLEDLRESQSIDQ